MAVVELGGGRRRPSDRIDHRVGLSDILPLGTKVEEGQPIAMVHAASREDADRIAASVRSYYGISGAPIASAPVIVKRLS
jgi:thymidine phosphorylase